MLVGRTWRMKPPWIDQGWSLVAGALANRGVHPPPTTSRPSLPPRCAAAPPTDCLRKLVTGRHPSGSRGIPVSSPSSRRKRVARLPASVPRVYPRCSLARYRRRPSCRSSGADLPRGQPTPSPCRRQPRRRPPPPLRMPGENTECHHPRTFSFPTQPRPSLSLESPRGPLGPPGLTLQGAARGHGEAFLSLFLLYFFFLSLLHFLFRAREKRDSSAESIR